ncbi:hypothetical protein BDB01DRAFT_851462 [Pilobolus umbonatus]|nr:hypothetical protein BDB01DRAFT_851462 [Pilobolus umbonatus]
MLKSAINKNYSLVNRRFISSSAVYRVGGIRAFKDRENAFEEQWARKVNHEELEAIRKQLLAQQKENAQLKQDISDANKRIDDLKNQVHKYHE